MEDAVRIAQLVIAAAAIAAVLVAGYQARITRDMAADQQRMLQEDLKTRLLLHYEDRFDAPEMLVHRRTLADRLRNFGVYQRDHPLADAQYDVIGDEVPGFFESLGTMLRRGDLDLELVWVFFDYYARNYWAALQNYIAEDTRRHGSDAWKEFEGLVRALGDYRTQKYRAPVPEITEAAIGDFLRQEGQAGR